MCVTMLNMKTATVRDVQHHFGKVLAWVEGGEEVQITRRSKLVARLVPSGPANPAPVSLPDFAARARAIWGAQPKGRSLSKTILAEREERL
jgi:antitoxin (DNA-binding transcriptional repressor) of toxin-antitoxin stability system